MLSVFDEKQIATEIEGNKQLLTTRDPVMARISMTIMNESSLNAIKKGDEDD